MQKAPLRAESSKIFCLFEVLCNSWKRWFEAGTSFVCFYAICRHRILALSGEFQQQEVYRQQRRAPCQKQWIIAKPAIDALVRSRVNCVVSIDNPQKLWLTPSCKFLHPIRQWAYKLQRTCTNAANPQSTFAPLLATNLFTRPLRRLAQGFTLGWFSSSTVQMENHHSQFVPKRASIVWTQPISLKDLIPTRYEQGRVENHSGDWFRQIVNQKTFLTVMITNWYRSESRQSSPSCSALKLSGAKRAMVLAVCQAPMTNINLHKIVS